MTKIIAFAGKKQSGKNSVANGITGHLMKKVQIVEWYDVNNEGQLVVPALVGKDDQGFDIIERRVLDLNDPREEVQNFLEEVVHPGVKTYSFATPLKNMAVNIFGLTYDQCYGTDEDKNTPTKIQWKNMPGFKGSKSNGELFVTGREFLQWFGTEVCRKIRDDCWTEYCTTQIQIEQPIYALITDMRYLNEAKAIKDVGGTIVYLTRDVAGEDNHSSETESIQIKDMADFVCDNQNLSIKEQNNQIIVKLQELKVMD